MVDQTHIIITTAKSILLTLHQQNMDDTETTLEDTEYILVQKTVIKGATTSAPDAFARQQVQQSLLQYARELYLQLWLAQEAQDDSLSQADQTYEEGLYWFDYIYEHGRYPE